MKVAVLGGGPVGLLCAIEAKKYFDTVYLIEKRLGYTRMNVPQIKELGLQEHLTQQGLTHHPSSNMNFGSFKEIETALSKNANSAGVTLLQPYSARFVRGVGEKKGGRFAQMALTCWPWDEESKGFALSAIPQTLLVDLLVVATGGGAAADNLVTGPLGFKYEKLKPKNYMAYGLFDPEADLEGVDIESQEYDKYKDQLEEIAQTISGVGNFTPRQADYQYFLTSLAGITAKDYKDLKAQEPLLKRLLVALKSAESMANGVREELKKVQRNVLAFKIQIQRACQFHSAEYPAVMVGDAAVTPHPDTASGYVSGFRGYQELVTLYEALSHTTAPADQSAIYQSFNDRYEMHVSEKALEGTVTIITHNLRLMDTYVSDLGILAVRAATDELTKVFEVRSKVAVKLKAKWQKLQDDAAGIQSRYKKHSGTLKPLDWKTTVGTLWSDLAHCWKLQKILTSDHTLLVEKIALLESQTKTVDQMKQAFPT